MPAAGGLKLRLESAKQQDRRGRFAHVRLSATGDQDPISLVTDARGRMRYRLADGDYELSLVEGTVVPFSVRDQRWTTVRVRLT
jgi:hypothetical protein